MRRSLCIVFVLCGCFDLPLGAPGAGTPLPAGGLPAAQTLEGGAQIRVSASGTEKLAALFPGILNEELEAAVCVAEQSVGDADVCTTTQGSCNGCSFVVNPFSFETTPLVSGEFNLQVRASSTASVRIEESFLPPCILSLTVSNMVASADFSLSIDPPTGALVVDFDTLNSVDASAISSSGCDLVFSRDAIIASLVESLEDVWTTDSLIPTLSSFPSAFQPDPQELAALIELPALAISGATAGNGAAVETRVVPGGYAQLRANGLSLGVVTGFNSDADPVTRSGDLASEPHACVAGLTAPDLGLPPFSLSTSPRGSFVLPAADAFLGTPETPYDLLVGVSRSALDLAGHHMVASGGLCLDVADDRVAFLRRDVLDDLLGLPLGDGDEELRLLVRPQHGLRFSVGTGGASPHLRALFDELRIDVEAGPEGATTPVLSLSADVDLGMLFITHTDAVLPVRLEATRSELGVSNPSVSVFDSRYAGIDPAVLDPIAGTLVHVVFSVLGADAGSFPVPGIAGTEAADVAVRRVTTASDDFLAVELTLGAFTQGLLTGSPPIVDAPAPTPEPLSISLVIPTPAELRAALLAGTSAGLPAVQLELPTSDGARPLEHAWRTQGGAWRPYVETGDLVIRDRSFAWQGERTIELRSRVVGDDSTASPVGELTVIIDYAPPTLFADEVSFSTYLVVPARDAVSTTLEYALGRVGESGPATPWTTDSNLDLADARALGDEVVVYVRDDAQNESQATVELPPLPPNDDCGDASSLSGVESQDVSFATDAASDPTASCGAGDQSVWFSILPPASGMAEISTSGSGYTTVVSVWPEAETCTALETEIACGTGGASVPVQAGVPLLVQVQRATPSGTGDLEIVFGPEPSAAIAGAAACATLAFLARRRRTLRV